MTLRLVACFVVTLLVSGGALADELGAGQAADSAVVAPVADASAESRGDAELVGTSDVGPESGAEATPITGFSWELTGGYRFWMEQRTGFPVDADGHELPETSLGQQTLDLGVRFRQGTWLDAQAGVRAISGELFGELPGTDVRVCADADARACQRQPNVADLMDGKGDNADWVEPRALFADIRTPVGLVRVGHQTSDWGLGMIAHAGTEQRSGFHFNDRHNGDLVERVLFVTRPGHFGGAPAPGSLADRWVLGLGADLVYRDENASLLDGDVAGQGVFVLALRPNPDSDAHAIADWQLGTYSVFRYQEDRDGDTLAVAALDLHGALETPLSRNRDPLRGRIEAEFVWLLGATTRIANDAAPTETDINAFGFVTEAGLAIPDARSDLSIQVGLATADANADDDTSYRFTFDPDFKVGLVLFDHVMAEVSAAATNRATDPERTAVPPKGVELAPSRGAVTGALFVAPMLVFEPLDGIALALGGLWARASGPLADPYGSFAAGGTAVNPFGVATDQRSLGVEIDAAARYRFPIIDDLMAEVRAEYAWFHFGGAFERPDGRRPEPIHYVSGRLSLLW